MINRTFLIFLLTCFAFLYFSSFLFAEKIAIVYTGNANASLYPCRCPAAQNGGVSRRATKIKELRKEYPYLLLLDSGSYFASGIQDIDKQTEELDKKRTKVILSTMEAMGYDAVGIGKEELIFGKEFLLETVKNSKINFLSCNLNLTGVHAFTVKKIGKIKIGVVGVSPLGLKIEKEAKNKQDFSEALKIVQDNVQKLKKQKVDIIILLSQLGQDIDKQLSGQIEGIDIIVSNQIASPQSIEEKIGSLIYLRPHLWARSLGLLELDIENGKIKNFTQKELPLSKEIANDPNIESFLPHCFQDKDCYKLGFVGRCKLAGEKEAACAFEEQVKVPLLIITAKSCKTCNVQNSLVWIKQRIPSISVSYLDSEADEAKKIIKNLGIEMLPALLLSKEITKHDSYNFLLERKIIAEKKDYYLVNPSFIGTSYFLGRNPQKNKLDLFISLRDKGVKSVLEKTKKILDKSEGKLDFHLHFLMQQDKNSGNFIAPYGAAEIKENKQAICVMEKYPQNFWDYLFCHIDNLSTGKQEACLTKLGMDTGLIKKCSQSPEGDSIFKENIKLTEELKIYYSPLFLLGNQEIFGVLENTTVEELERIVTFTKEK